MAERKPLDTVYICDWLPPEFGAVGQYGVVFTRAMAALGQHVALIGLTTGRERLDREDFTPSGGSLAILRLEAAKVDKSSKFKRALWAMRVNTLLLWRAWPYIHRTKRVVFTGSPPFFLHWIMPAKLIFRRPVVYRITDFHPECAIAERGTPNLLYNAILFLTLFWRRQVDTFEVLGDDQKRRLTDIGIEPSRIKLKPDPAPIDIRSDQAPLRRPEGFEGKKLLLYSGNWGVAHEVKTFVEGYAAHHREGRGGIVLWLNAVGGNADKVEAELRVRKLPVHRSQPVPIDELAALLVTPDAHLITLKDAFVGYVLPSKVHGCVRSNRPVLFIGSKLSDVHQICNTALGLRYMRADVGAVQAVAAYLDQLAKPCGALTGRTEG